MSSEFQRRVYATVRKIPHGRVTTYRAVARAIHHPRASRAVGNVLNKNPFPKIPCHRVVRSDFKVGGYVLGTKKKIKMLRREGVNIKKGGWLKSIFGIRKLVLK